MAPDIISVPSSPRNPTNVQETQIASTGSRRSSTNTSRRVSQIAQMNPPPLPLASVEAVTSVPASSSGNAFPPFNPNLSSSVNPQLETGVPTRHPKPLTAAELHLELEKEQEALVNRLTRELSGLRAHSASVTSTTSSTTSAGPGVLLEATDPSIAHAGALTGPTHPTGSRSHRSSSNVSRGSASLGHTAPFPHRYSISSQASGVDGQIAPPRTNSISLSTPRYEEVAHYRQELDEARRENVLLRNRIKELEGLLKTRRESHSEGSAQARKSVQEQSTAEEAGRGVETPT